MPLPIDLSAVAQSTPALVESTMDLEDFIQTQAEDNTSVYELIAARRAQLEDAETLRRVRAL